VLDPHLAANARRKEMEDEMDEEEKDGLRGWWLGRLRRDVRG